MWPNGDLGYSAHCHMLGRERPEVVLPDRTLCLSKFSHLLIVNFLSLSRFLTAPPLPATAAVLKMRRKHPEIPPNPLLFPSLRHANTIVHTRTANAWTQTHTKSPTLRYAALFLYNPPPKISPFHALLPHNHCDRSFVLQK